MEDVVIMIQRVATIQERERVDAHHVIMKTQEAETTEMAQIVAMATMDLAEI